MELIDQLEALRIPDSAFLGLSESEQENCELVNGRLDDCLDIVWKWLQEKDLLNE